MSVGEEKGTQIIKHCRRTCGRNSDYPKFTQIKDETHRPHTSALGIYSMDMIVEVSLECPQNCRHELAHGVGVEVAGSHMEDHGDEVQDAAGLKHARHVCVCTQNPVRSTDGEEGIVA